MFYIEKDNKIILFDENLEKLQNILMFIPELEGLEILETERPIKNFQFVDTEKYKNELAEKERECINMFSLTAADIERAIYKVKGLDFDDILELVKNNSNIDAKALKIELKANNFYRGNPYVSTIGNLLGFTEEQLDKFFETGNSEELK